MKFAIFCFICTASVFVFCEPPSNVTTKSTTDFLYSDELDDFDVVDALNNKRLFNFYLECFRTGKGCNAQAQKVRDIMPDVIKTECAHCTETQKRKGRIVADFILEKHPEIFLEFEHKYDPERTYRQKYAERLKQEKIVLPD